MGLLSSCGQAAHGRTLAEAESPLDSPRPARNRAMDSANPAAGPAAATSQRSLRDRTSDWKGVMAPKAPRAPFGTK